MADTIIHGQIVKLDRMNNSKMGNPQWLVRIYKVDETIEFRTTANASVGYRITDNMLNKWATFQVQGNVRQSITDISLDK